VNKPVVSVVDDDNSVRLAVGSLIRSFGFTTFTFASADEFLQSPQLAHTGCLITDVQMPGMNGIELQRVILERGRRVPIIFVTAFPEESARKRALDAGALAFLTKPFDIKNLISLVSAAMRPAEQT
jgi:FixJ family two-component response regulator